MTVVTKLPDNIFDFTQRKRLALAHALLPDEGIAHQDPKITAVGIKVLRDMDTTEISVKRLQLDDKIAGDNASVARAVIQATYNNIADGVTPYIDHNPDMSKETKFDMPEDIMPGFEPGDGVVGVGVSDRTYGELMQGDTRVKNVKTVK